MYITFRIITAAFGIGFIFGACSFAVAYSFINR